MPAVPLSLHRTHQELVFTSGLLGPEPDGTFSPSFGRQMELALETLETCLASAGASLQSVLKTTVFIVDRGDFPEMNEIYERRFPQPWPARSTIVTDLTLPDLLFEIEAIAYRVDG